MGLTPEYFFRGLETAFHGLDYRVDAHTVTAGTEARGVTVGIRTLPPRRLSGLLSMARCEVTLTFRGYEAKEQAAFLEVFDRAYRRGGG